MNTTSSPDGAPSPLRDRHPWLVLAGGLLITLMVTWQVKAGVERVAVIELTARCDLLQTNIVERLDDYARLLQRGGAFFEASEKVTREQWRLFNNGMGELAQQLPGIQGIGFSLLIPSPELPRHLRELRGEGFPEYAIKPAGYRPLYTSIIYLEPFSGRNLQAFGYDMFSDPVRRMAMEQARDSGAATLSGRIVLVQDVGVDVQSGALMYLPVYGKGLPHETVVQRRAALLGWVYSPYRMGELLQGILGRQHEEKAHLHIQLFDGGEHSPQTLLFESHWGTGNKGGHLFHETRHIKAKGRLWTLNVTQTGGGFFSATYLVVWITMVGGVVISLLLFNLGRSLLNTRGRAEALAQIMTRELRNSEANLSMANQEWCDTFDTMPDLIAIIDTSYRITRANAAMTAAMRVNGEDIPGVTCYQKFHGLAAPPADCPHRRLLADGAGHSSINYEERLGAWYQITATPIFDEAGKLMGSVHVAHDVTQAREREQQLLLGEATYRRLHQSLQDAREYAENIVETVREPLLVLDSDLKILTANQSFYDTFRVTPRETIGNFIYDLGSRQWDIPALRLLLEDILQKETLFNGYEVEHEFPEIGCRTILLNARQVYRENIGSHIILLAMEDITQRKQLVAEIRNAREYAENIVETVRESLLVLDSDLKILTANQSFYDTFRVTPRETIGNFIYDLGSRQWDIPALRLLFEEILPREIVFNGYEVEHEFPEIGRKTILLNAREILREKSGVRTILLAMEDITQSKEIQVALRLEEQVKIESITRLAAGVAHEINNPMSFISSNMRVLTEYFDQIVRFDRFRQDLDDSDSSSANRDAVAVRREELEIDSILDDGVDLVSATLEGARRIAKIIQDLKSYTQHKRPVMLDVKATLLDHCLESALTICCRELQCVASIRKEYEPLPMVLCNQGQLSQVFLNLLVNAGHSIVSETPGEIVLRSRHDDAFVYVSVSDSGGGIPEEVKKRIFDPFFTTKKAGKGTGLGLSISSEIIKKHNGELLVESVVGVGTTFTVKLPRPEEIVFGF